MKVTLSDKFKIRMPTFDDNTRQAILDFITHIKQHGLKGLQGRNKSSAKPNPHTKKEQADFKNATKNCLWHYHIGVPNYVGEFGDMTSEYILHYQRFDDEIVLVDISTHPPFELPNLN